MCGGLGNIAGGPGLFSGGLSTNAGQKIFGKINKSKQSDGPIDDEDNMDTIPNTAWEDIPNPWLRKAAKFGTLFLDEFGRPREMMGGGRSEIEMLNDMWQQSLFQPNSSGPSQGGGMNSRWPMVLY